MEPRLDSSQRSAAEISFSERQIVMAGPGSGKTEVVSVLIEHLVENEEVDPGDGLLVIAFSNAAVHAADRRLRERGLGPVTVQTMDSLAGELLRDLSDDDYSGLGFDARIKRATTLLGQEGWQRIEDLDHLVVDEVQDVVGVRADFLMAITARLGDGAGFTLLGDPAQAIYDFQLRTSKRTGSPLSSTTTRQLLSTIETQHRAELRRLDGQYRALSRDARRVASLRSGLLDGDADELETFRAGLVSLGGLDEVPGLAERWQGTTVFLTATNGQALLVERALAEVGAVSAVRRSAQQRVIASWVAELLADHPAASMSRAAFQERAAERRPDVTPDTAWRSLRALSGGRGQEVDLSTIARRLRGPRSLPPDLIDQPETPFVVSTVHRAKGLEFDNVVLVDFPEHPWHARTDENADERAREWYVALTRARRLIVRAQGPDDRRVRRHRDRAAMSDRWCCVGRERWQTFGFEMRVEDVDRAEPGGEDTERVQRLLSAGLRPGADLELALDPLRSTLVLPVYDVKHGGVSVGRTSREFGETLVSRIRTGEKRDRPWPVLRGAHVETVASVAGDPQQGPVGRHGIWLAPTISCMLTLAWKDDPDD